MIAVLWSRCEGEIVHVGEGLGGVVEAVAVLPAVAGSWVLRPADGVLYPGTHLAVGGVGVFLARQQEPVRAFAVWYDHPAVEVAHVRPSGAAPGPACVDRRARRGLPLIGRRPRRLVPDNLKTGVGKPDEQRRSADLRLTIALLLVLLLGGWLSLVAVLGWVS